MTNSQTRQVNNIKAELKRMFDFNTYEFKTWKVIENEYFVSVAFQVGMIGDEGTVAAVIARDSGQIFIGKRGGLKYPVFEQLKTGDNHMYCRELKQHNPNIWAVICAQR